MIPNKIRKDDIIISVKPKAGMTARSVTGLLDSRIFTGENKLHAIKENGLWYLKYDAGRVPGALQQQFTSWHIMMTFLTNYFGKRNIEIDRVID